MFAFTRYFGADTTRSGLPIDHSSSFAKVGAFGWSAGLPIGAPPSAHRAISRISAALSDGSSFEAGVPTVSWTCEGGISRFVVRSLMARAQGRTVSYDRSDIGAICPGRWQLTQ